MVTNIPFIKVYYLGKMVTNSVPHSFTASITISRIITKQKGYVLMRSYYNYSFFVADQDFLTASVLQQTDHPFTDVKLTLGSSSSIANIHPYNMDFYQVNLGKVKIVMHLYTSQILMILNFDILSTANTPLI